MNLWMEDVLVIRANLILETLILSVHDPVQHCQVLPDPAALTELDAEGTVVWVRDSASDDSYLNPQLLKVFIPRVAADIL